MNICFCSGFGGSLFHYRYRVSERIKYGNYKVFREQWGNEPADIRHRRSWIILILCIANIILFPILPIILSMLHII